MASIDEAIVHLGGFGRCQQLVIAVACTQWATHSMKAFSLVFVRHEFGDDVGELSRSVFFFGWIIGLLFWGSFARRHGWLRALVLAQVLATSFGLCDALAQTATAYCVAWMFGGFAQGAVLTCSFSYANDFLPPSHRACGGGLIQLGFPFGVLSVTAMAFCMHDASWRALSALCSVIGLPAAIAAALCLPESLRWLHDAGSRPAFLSGVRRLALINGQPAPDSEFCVMHATRGKDKGHGGRTISLGGELLSSHHMRRITLALCAIWATSSAVGFGISFDTGRLYGKDWIHAVMATGPVLQLPSIFVATRAMETCGRLPTMRRLLLLAALSCFALGLACTVAPLPAVIGDEISDVARWSDAAAQAGAEAARIDHLWRAASRGRLWGDRANADENRLEEQAARAAAWSAAARAKQMAAAAEAASEQLRRDQNSVFLFLVSALSVLASAVGRASASLAMNMIYIVSAELWPTQAPFGPTNPMLIMSPLHPHQLRHTARALLAANRTHAGKAL